MLAANHDIYTDQKSEYVISFEYFDSSDQAITISNSYDNVRFVVTKSSLPQDNHLFEISEDGSATEGYLTLPLSEVYGSLVVSANEITITVSTDTMTTIYPGSYFYKLFFESNSGESDCILKGKFVVEAP